MVWSAVNYNKVHFKYRTQLSIHLAQMSKHDIIHYVIYTYCVSVVDVQLTAGETTKYCQFFSACHLNDMVNNLPLTELTCHVCANYFITNPLSFAVRLHTKTTAKGKTA